MAAMRRPRTPTNARQICTPPQPSSPPRGGSTSNNTPWLDVLELCKKGFTNKMQTLTEEMMFSIKAQVKEEIGELRNEVLGSMASRENPISSRMDDLIEKTQLVSSQLPLDFAPVMERLHACESAQETSMQAVVDKLDKMMVTSSQINDSGLGIAEMLQRLEAQIDRLEAKANTSSEQLEEIVDVQSWLKNAATQIAQDVHLSQQQESMHRTELSGILEKQIGERLSEVRNHVAAIDYAEMRAHIISNRRQVESESRNVLMEISRIQQAMHLDFLDVMSDKVDKNQRYGSEPGSPKSPTSPKAANKPIVPIVERGITKMPRKRLREMFVQTEEVQLLEKITQTEAALFQDDKEREKRKNKHERKRETLDNQIVDVTGTDKLIKHARAASVKPQYNVFDRYWDTGIAQRIAKSTWFENVTLTVVFVNAIWLSVDSDLNPEALVVNAPTVFQIAENLFCSYFFIEIIIRFCAFKKKQHCLVDFWWVFDALLVLFMVGETWILTIVFLTSQVQIVTQTGTVSVLKTIRMAKLLKLSRLVRLLRALPELVLISKGIGLAARSVAVFFVFWFIVVYVFALTFKEVTDGAGIGKTYFRTVPMAINTLLLKAIFPESASMINELADEFWYLWPVIFFFFCLASITIMYMLVGVLVDVVGVIATVEKESLTVSYVASELRDELEEIGYTLDLPITKYQFEKIVLEPKIVRIIDSVGVDVVILCDMIDLVFEDKEKKGQTGLEFPELIESILSMRGSNPATVKDCKESLRMTKLMLGDSTALLTKKVLKEFDDLKLELQELREDIRDADHRKAINHIMSSELQHALAFND
eukprot:TRINITY_DN27229_c0_g1_i1.p1 TRINITY_DN27229_c0_g1~~TRINITY_DN27229_c0_g1_i1.p1  ORF type:complete len:830 (+),score=163.02 TRINITY_DN27229_c0_g1_i1:28-2490(+)